MRTSGLDLPLRIDRSDPRPLSVQLASGLRAAVTGGLLQPGDRLPASRALAGELGISRGTVTAAYEQLDGEGYLRSTQGGGTYISGSLAPSAATAPRRPAHEHPPARALLDLTPGQPDTRRLADSSWRRSWREASTESLHVTEPPAAGLPELRTEIAEHLRIARGLASRTEDLIVTAGTREGLTLLVQSMQLDSARPILVGMENPGYPSACAVLTQLGAEVLYLPVDDDGLMVDHLPTGNRCPQIIFTTPSHQYPLGGRLSVARRQALLRWARHHEAVIVEDDYDSEFRHTGMPLPAMAALDPAAVVHLGTFSKILTPSLRAGYLVASPALIGRMVAVRERMGNPVSIQTQLALTHHLASGGVRRHIARTRRDYRHRRELLIRTLAGCPLVSTRGLDGGLHAVLDLQVGTDVASLVARAAEKGLLVADLAEYYFDGRPDPGVVLGYGGATDTELVRSLKILIDLIENP